MRSIEVLNKADLMGGVASVPVRPNCIAVSAVTSEGLDALKAEGVRQDQLGVEAWALDALALQVAGAARDDVGDGHRAVCCAQATSSSSARRRSS